MTFIGHYIQQLQNIFVNPHEKFSKNKPYAEKKNTFQKIKILDILFYGHNGNEFKVHNNKI